MFMRSYTSQENSRKYVSNSKQKSFYLYWYKQLIRSIRSLDSILSHLVQYTALFNFIVTRIRLLHVNNFFKLRLQQFF